MRCRVSFLRKHLSTSISCSHQRRRSTSTLSSLIRKRTPSNEPGNVRYALACRGKSERDRVSVGSAPNQGSFFPGPGRSRVPVLTSHDKLKHIGQSEIYLYS